MRLAILIACTLAVIRSATIQDSDTISNNTVAIESISDEIEPSVVLFSSVQYQPMQSVHPIKHKKVSSMDELEGLLYDGELEKSVVYHLPDKSIFVHRTALNGAALVGGLDTYFAYAGSANTDPTADETRWYHVKASKNESVMGASVPVSACFSQEYGEGGTISRSINVGFLNSVAFDLTLGYSYILFFGAGGGINVAAGFSVKGSVSCNVKKGQRGQIMLQPYVTKYPEAKYREIQTSSGEFEYKKWKTVSHIAVVDTSKPLIVKCVTNPAEMMCNVPFGR